MHLLTLGAIVSVIGCLSLHVSPVVSWQLIQDAHPLPLSQRQLITHFYEYE